MPLLDHFGFIAPFYELVIRPRHPEKLIEMAGLPTNGFLLDAGGGTGRIAQTLRSQADRVVVADLSLGMIREAARKDGLLPVQSHTERLPFPPETFDVVVMVDALHHVCNQAETAQELWRVLRTGGRIVVEEPDVQTRVVKVIAIAEKLALMRSHFLTPYQIAGLFTDKRANRRIVRESWNSWVVIEKG